MERLLIDTDPGVDDAQAILMASAHPNAKIEAIFAIGGNVGLNHTVRNALTIVETIGQDIPVYQGNGQPLVYASEDAAEFHGADGMGDAGFVPVSKTVAEGHAALKLVEMVNENPGEFTLVALGPLTNIALAVHLDPDLPSKLKRFVIMGGAVTSHGNTPILSAEFNIYYDPEGALVVFECWGKAGKQIEVIDWEATMRHRIGEEAITRWMNLDTPRARFFQAISARSIEFVKGYLGHVALLAPDPLAMAVVLEPDCALRQETHYLTVETTGMTTRGQTTVDWYDRSGNPANATIILDVDQARFEALFEQGLQ